MFSQEMENLIEATLQDGVLTEQEKAVLVKRAQNEGIDLDELDVYIHSILQKRHQAEADLHAEEDKKSKMGGIKKCPNCGAVVQPGDAACSYCGYAFDGAPNTQMSSMQILSTKLEEAERDVRKNMSAKDKLFNQEFILSGQRKMTILSNFPVPNTRADLLDFLSSVMPKANKGGSTKGINRGGTGEELSLGYWNLFANCILKAKISFANDEAFKPFFDFYEEENKKRGQGGQGGCLGKLFGLIFGK